MSTVQAQIDSLRADLRTIADVVSREGGQQHAKSAVLLAITVAAGHVPEIEAVIEEHLERAYVSQLGGSTNPVAVTAFEEMAALFRHAIAESKQRHAKPGGDSQPAPPHSS